MENQDYGDELDSNQHRLEMVGEEAYRHHNAYVWALARDATGI